MPALTQEAEKYEVLLRYRAIELIAFWEGRLNTPRLIGLFGISRQQASKDIKRYCDNYNPDALVYDKDLKAYKPEPDFKPVLSQGHINEYMDMLIGLISQSQPGKVVDHPLITAVSYPDRAIQAKTVRVLLEAARKQQVVSLIYMSMTNPEGIKRQLSPHRLIYSGFRWHVRAYCHERQSYRDFNLSRMSQVEAVKGDAFVSDQSDDKWQQTISFHLVPNPNLSESQQKLIKKDYAMTRGKLKLTTQKALVHYTLQRYQVPVEDYLEQDAIAYPLVVSELDKAKVHELLFDAS